MNKVSFFTADCDFKFTIRKAIITLINKIFKDEDLKWMQIDLIFCSDAYLLSINRTFLNHDFYTDIITFPLHEAGFPIYSEIYISIERIKENAKKYKIEYQNELLRVVIHGILHLCGYKDKRPKERERISIKEDYYLSYYYKIFT